MAQCKSMTTSAFWKLHYLFMWH